MEIKVINPSDEELEVLNVRSWPIWEKEESSFDWHYDEKETCYFLEGDVLVECPGGKEVRMKKGNLVIFPKGLSCRWKIIKKVKKRYNFG